MTRCALESRRLGRLELTEDSEALEPTYPSDCSVHPSAPQNHSNPFSTRFVRPGLLEFLFPPGVQLANLLDRLAQFQYRGQIVGAHGTGKSTLLSTLIERLAKQGARSEVVNAPERHRGRLLRALLESRNQQGLVIVDGFERLSAFERTVFVRLACMLRSGFVVTTHAECRLPVIWRTEVTERLAERIVDRLTRRVPAARAIARRNLATRLGRHAGNMRETLFELYDVHRDAMRRQPRADVRFG